MGWPGSNGPSSPLVHTGHGIAPLSAIPNPQLVDRFRLKLQQEQMHLQQQQQQQMQQQQMLMMQRNMAMMRNNAYAMNAQYGAGAASAAGWAGGHNQVGHTGVPPVPQTGGAPSSAAPGGDRSGQGRAIPMQQSGTSGARQQGSQPIPNAGRNQVGTMVRKAEAPPAPFKKPAPAVKAKQIGVYQHRSGLVVPIMRTTIGRGRSKGKGR
eukprot:jgi/Mesvir1/15291/Mv06504-RA.1